MRDGRHKRRGRTSQSSKTCSCAHGVARGDGRHKARGRTSQSRWSSRFELVSQPASLERGSRPTRRCLNSHVGAWGRTSTSSKTCSCAHGVARGDGRHKAQGPTSQKLQKCARARTAWLVGTDVARLKDGRYKALETCSCAHGVARGDGRHKRRGRTQRTAATRIAMATARLGQLHATHGRSVGSTQLLPTHTAPRATPTLHHRFSFGTFVHALRSSGDEKKFETK